MDTNGMGPIPDKLRDNFAVIRRQENRRNIMKKPKKLLIYKDGAGKLPPVTVWRAVSKGLIQQPRPLLMMKLSGM